MKKSSTGLKKTVMEKNNLSILAKKMENRISDNREEGLWKKRAALYNKLEWATEGKYLQEFLKAGEFQMEDFVLDIGTGPGLIAHKISPYTKRVIGIDICSNMLKQARQNRVKNEIFIKSNAKRLPFNDSVFSKVTARMVFHHIIKDTQEAMDECFRVLKNGGLMVISEGIPPTEHVKPFYVEMFKYKEQRLTFMEEDLENLVKKSGFSVVNKIIHWNKKSSIKNWLENSSLDSNTQNKIFQMHLDLDDRGKKDYNMVRTDNDCLIDMKFAIVVCQK